MNWWASAGTNRGELDHTSIYIEAKPKMTILHTLRRWALTFGPDGSMSTGRFGSASGADSDGAGPSPR